MPDDDSSARSLPFARAIDRAELLTQRVAAAVRDAIVSGQLAPGARLSVPELARQLGVSRTPAREGLLVLEREGLVATRATSGMEVISGGRDDVLDLLDVREGLETMAVRRAAERMDASAGAALARIVAAHRRAVEVGDLRQHVELDAEFHRAIRDGASNDRLARALTQIEQQLRVLNSRLSSSTGWSGTAVIRDHEAILEAIVAHDPAGAERALRSHIGRTRAFGRGDELGAEEGGSGL